MSSSLWKYTRHTCLEAVKQAIKYRRPFCRNLYIFSALLLILAIRTKCRNEGTGPRPLKLAPLLPICHDIEARVCERGGKSCWLTVYHKSTRQKGPVTSVEPNFSAQTSCNRLIYWRANSIVFGVVDVMRQQGKNKVRFFVGRGALPNQDFSTSEFFF